MRPGRPVLPRGLCTAPDRASRLVERSTNRNRQTSHREGDDVRHDRAVTILHETEIDGVRCYWVATERRAEASS
jgi:hypothetical protein